MKLNHWPAGRAGGAIGLCVDPERMGGGHACSVDAAAIDCPTCGASTGYRCITRDGRGIAFHVLRSRGARSTRAAG